MNHLWNLVRKEVKELLTPSSVGSVLAVCILLIVLGSTIGGQVSKSTELKAVGYIDWDDGGSYSQVAIDSLENYYEKAGYDPDKFVIKLDVSVGSEESKILDEMVKHGVDTAVKIPEYYSTQMDAFIEGTVTSCPSMSVYWNQTSTSIFSSLSTVTGTNAVTQMCKGVFEEISRTKGGLDPAKMEKILYPSIGGSTFFHGDLKKNTSPDMIYSAISTQTMFIPLIIMLIITMIGNILISSMGNEKENKTLETLLTLPISRTTIVSGKLVGCAIAGLVMGAIYVAGTYFYISGIMGSRGGTSLADLGINIGVTDWLIIALFIFLGIMCALGLCMILGAFAKNFKAAQTYVAPIAVLAIIPMFATMFTDFSSLPLVFQILLFLIPFTHPMMVFQNIMFGNWMLVIGGAVYLVAFAALMIYITVKLYKSDILLTGLLKKDDGKFSLSGLFNKSRQ